MKSHAKFDPELELLVQEVKAEMIENGLRYSGNLIGRPRSIDKLRRVKPDNGKYVVRDEWSIQFRGTPRKRENQDRNMLIKSNHYVIPILRGEKENKKR